MLRLNFKVSACGNKARQLELNRSASFNILLSDGSYQRDTKYECFDSYGHSHGAVFRHQHQWWWIHCRNRNFAFNRVLAFGLSALILRAAIPGD
mmetsp:Transcript_62886/g.185735  ORF Transcript_62886/g.185735 Transcript_62886/m.185735 type:complete len:94 (+) Transcript_62886:265-546(+)